MSLPAQKTIDQFLEDKNIPAEKKDAVLAAITHVVYSRNQAVIGLEKAEDATRHEQLLRSVEEYEQIIEEKIFDILAGKDTINYDF